MDRVTENFCLFFRSESKLSNWHSVKFTWKGENFLNSEAAMMWAKCMLHKDFVSAKEVLANQNPSSVKKVGRAMKGFDYKLWGEYKKRIMVGLLLAKFSQNKEYKEYLLSMKGKRFVEASPFDKIWGNGLSKTDPKACMPSKWEGQNLLGDCLDEVFLVISENPSKVHYTTTITK
jgi:ribA/ribD-fused uncharacterized protein